MLPKMKDSLALSLNCLLLWSLPQLSRSFSFSISGKPSCDGRPFRTVGVSSTCSNSCQPGDTVTVSGLVLAKSGFDYQANVKLQACISGPAGLVTYYCYDPIYSGGICDWVSSPTVSCGEPSGDYEIFKDIVVPTQAEELEEKYGSVLSIKVKAIVDGSEECEASYSSYGTSASIAGTALVVGVLLRRRQRRHAALDEQEVYVEMGKATASDLPTCLV